jgi:RNA polymerase sigma-70 factor, ECF subfamily
MTTLAATRTTTALLAGLQDPANDAAWDDLLSRCTPMMRQVAIRIGVPTADLDDVIQATWIRFVESWRTGLYDRTRGRLSSFILVILRSRSIDHLRQVARNRTETDVGEAQAQVPGDDELDQVWVDARQRQVLSAALDQLRAVGTEARVLEAFELYAIRATSVDEVADRLGISREDVYNAKYRITRRLQPIVARLDEVYEDL